MPEKYGYGWTDAKEIIYFDDLFNYEDSGTITLYKTTSKKQFEEFLSSNCLWDYLSKKEIDEFDNC